MLSPAFLDELRARTTLSALVASSVKLERAGREYRACCPFHHEKTPSFYVNDEKGFYHCFGCSAHGDAIRWMTEQRGLSFIDAVKELAETAGMTLPAPDPRAAQRIERDAGLHDVMAAAERWFAARLASEDGKAARAYLAQRGIDADAIAAFGIGFAPDTRGGLRIALARHGDAALVECGLLITVDGKEPYDRFRGRVMIPIRDARGRTIAFGGRILGAGEPKYLNSPDTPLFDKGRTLYNLDRAAGPARKAGRLVIVEGYMDVIALARIGVAEAVAPLGTALTEAQIERCWRIVDAPTLCFDGDAAGRKAAARAAMRALPLLTPGRSLQFVTLPAGVDPDDVARRDGAAGVEKLLESASPLADFAWRAEHDAQPLRTPEARAGLKQRLDALIATIGHADVRRHYAREWRDRFDAVFFARRDMPARSGRSFVPSRPALSSEARTIGSGGLDYAPAVLAGLLRYPDVLGDVAEALAQLPIGDRRHARLRDALVGLAYEGGAVDPAALAPILADAELGGLAARLQEPGGLAFSFTRDNADGAAARTALAGMIEMLAARPQLDAALASATADVAAGGGEASLAEQHRLAQARHEADRQLARLHGIDDGI